MTKFGTIAAAPVVIAAISLPVLAQDAVPVPLPSEQPTIVVEQRTRAALTERFSVALDFAGLTRVPPATATLVLGNPAIADATIQRNGLIVVTGKSYGTTNLLALDRDGGTLHEMTINVVAPTDGTLTVLRGTARETWSCSPRCEQTVTLGDSSDFFGASSGQIGSRNGLATQR